MAAEEGRMAHKDLVVWQKSMVFVNQVIDLIENLDTSRKHYRIIDQLEAAVTSIPMNIAEGMQSTPLGKVGIRVKNICTFSTSQEGLFMRH